MARAADIEEFTRAIIKKVLDDIGRDILNELKDNLVNKSYDDKNKMLKVSKSQMEKAKESSQVVDIIIALYTADRAVGVTVQALRDVGQNQAAAKLEREAAAGPEQDERKRKSKDDLDGGPSRKMKRSEGENEGTETEGTEETVIRTFDKYYLSDIEKFVDENREQLVTELQAKLDSDTFNKLKANLTNKKLKPLRFKGSDVYNIIEELAKELFKIKVKLKDSQIKKVIALLFKSSPSHNVKDAPSPSTAVTSPSIAATSSESPLSTSVSISHPRNSQTAAPASSSPSETIGPFPSTTKNTAITPSSSAHEDSTSPTGRAFTPAASPPTDTSHPTPEQAPASSLTSSVHTPAISIPKDVDSAVVSAPTTAQSVASPLDNALISYTSSAVTAQRVEPSHPSTASTSNISAPTAQTAARFLPDYKPTVTTPSRNTAPTCAPSPDNHPTATSFAHATPLGSLSSPDSAPLVSPLTVKQDGASENDFNPSASLFSSEESLLNGSLPHSLLHSTMDPANPDSEEDETQSSEEDQPPENENCQLVKQRILGNVRQTRATASQMKIEALKEFIKDRAQEAEEQKVEIKDLIESVNNITERAHKQYHCLVAEDILIYKDPEYGSAILEIKMPKPKKTSEVPIDKCKDFRNVYTKQGNFSSKEKFLMMINMGVVNSIFMTAVYFRGAKDPLVWYSFSKGDFKTFTDHFKKCFSELLVPVIALYKDVQRGQLRTDLTA